jgi:uncharacterized LabA/DUF88 family protein
MTLMTKPKVKNAPKGARRERTVVYVDGQNFLYKAAEVLTSAKLVKDKQDVNAIDIKWLLGQVLEGDFEVRFYGVKKIRRRPDLGKDILTKSRKFADNLRKLRNYLAKANIKYIDAGSLKVRDSDVCKKCGAKDLRFQEKGVDVGLAVDIVKDALLGQVDKVVLFSSDTDLIPAILAAKEVKKQVIYVGFEDKLTKALYDRTDKTKILRDKEVVEAWQRTKN